MARWAIKETLDLLGTILFPTGYAKTLQKPSLGRREVFHFVLIKPTRYDEQGYSIHWHFSPTSSNSLACLLSLANECRDKAVLGPDVEICVTQIDEVAEPVDCAALIKNIRQAGGKALIGLVGVQSNQYPRAMDLARKFRDAKLPVCIGGFHVTGVLSMFSEPPPEIVEATKMGVSLFLGEAENGRLAEVLRDAYDEKMRNWYDYRNDLPGLEGEPVPLLPAESIKRSLINMTCMDLGRGCPFDCSFCCIINVQGKKSRYRSADDLERILLENHKNGIYRYFITDDNFARNRNWKLLFSRMIEVQKREGFKLYLVMQVDMMCHKIPGFIEMAAEAGAEMVFCGLESINPDNLKQMQKPQNRLSEYRNMLLQWKRRNVLLVGGYIFGFPTDTRETVLRDIDVIKRELPVDMLSFSLLTPLPGSRDHKEMVNAGDWMDPDLNKYDLTHAVIRHPRMSIDELDKLYIEAFSRFYTEEHMKTVLRRTAALGGDRKLTLAERFLFYGSSQLANGIFSLDAGPFRAMYRHSRRPGFATENWLKFHLKRCFAMAKTFLSIRRDLLRARRTAQIVWKEVIRDGYQDTAITTQTKDRTIELHPLGNQPEYHTT